MIIGRKRQRYKTSHDHWKKTARIPMIIGGYFLGGGGIGGVPTIGCPAGRDRNDAYCFIYLQVENTYLYRGYNLESIY